MSTLIAERIETNDGLTSVEDLLEAYVSSPPRETRSRPMVEDDRSEEALDEANRLRVLVHLLRMADSYRAQGSLRQAREMYFELINSHSGTVQAIEARDRLFDMAEGYDEAGEHRSARSIYEQLL